MLSSKFKEFIVPTLNSKILNIPLPPHAGRQHAVPQRGKLRDVYGTGAAGILFL